MNMSGGVRSSNGTSLAAPQVAGAVALILSQNPNLTPQVVKRVIEASAYKVPGMNGQIFHNYYGYGLLDVYEALRALNSIYVFKNVIMSNVNDGELVIDNDVDHPVPSNSDIPVKYEVNHISRTDELPFLVNWNGSGTTQKHNRWYDDEDSDYNLQLSFTANSLTPPVKDANFNSTIPVTLINNFPEVGTLNPLNDNIWLKDPWFYYQSGNNWFQSNEFKSYSAPFQIQNNSTSSYGGVFQDQLVSSGAYYSVRSLPQDIDLGGTLGIRKFCFRSWTGTNAEFSNANFNQTGVVFTSSNAEVVANLKGSQLSNDITAYDYNSQKKFVRTDNGNLHNIYISMGALWYERSTNGGTTWDIVGGQPINSNNPKQVSIDYLPPGSGTEVVLIAYQCTTSTGSKVVVDVYINGAPRAGQFRYDVVSFTHTPGEYSEMNAEPVISLAQEWDFLIIYKVPGLLPEGGDDPTQAGLYYSFGWLNGLLGWQLTWYNPGQKWVMIPTTGINSIHPTIGCEIYSGYNYFHIAYQENNQIKYYYRYGQTRTGSLVLTGNPVNISSTSGFSQNYYPSIIAIGQSARVCWVGYRVIYPDPEPIPEIDGIPQWKVLFKGTNNPGSYWQFGNYVSSPNINKRNDDSYYALAWSEESNQIKFADNTLSTVRTISGVTGQKLQICNGSDKNNMYCMAYEHNSGVPFYFTKSNSLGSFYNPEKVLYGDFTSGREGVVSVDSAGFFFAIGDIKIDGEPIDFIEIEDSVIITNLAAFNEYLITEPVSISDNSSFVYSVLYGINDSLSAELAMIDDRFINFKVQLVDANTGEIIGEYDNVTYDSENIYHYNNIEYQVNTQGIGNRTVRLKLIVNNNFVTSYSLSQIYSDEAVLGKTKTKEININGSEVIKSYELSQNYPNPFNPATTIRYQLPKDGMVTLKVYDILGAEVVTLVNEEKAAGKYEVNFDASRLASGVYIYRIQVNEFNSVKKMVLLK
jgi:hypothetical protein